MDWEVEWEEAVGVGAVGGEGKGRRAASWRGGKGAAGGQLG